MVGGVSQEHGGRIQLSVSVATVGGRYISRSLRCDESVSGTRHTATDGSVKNPMGKEARV